MNTRQASPMTPDAVPGNWVTHMPGFAQPYLRLARADRPIGTWLLLIPCWQGMALANASADFSLATALWFALLFAVGAFVMRGAGCAYNDIVDRDFDAKVERTALRPIAAGEISVMQAWGFLIALALIGLVVLLQFNRTAIMLGFASLALVAAYPFMKRVTWWPQAWLGLTFNWGALLAFAAIAGALAPEAFLIYAAGFFWTLGYDTIYAHQDKEDDALIGVKSSALRLGAASRKWIGVFYACVIALFAAAGLSAGFSILYFIALAPAAMHFAWQVASLDINNGTACLALFKSNRTAGLLLLGALICEMIVSRLAG